MAILFYPNRVENSDEIITFLIERGFHYEKWVVDDKILTTSTDQDILKSYETNIKDFCTKKGYKTFDIINVNTNTQNLEQLRQKFLKEHTHSEDEVRFFIYGKGLFWFNYQEEIFALLCEAGDILSVPALYKHWFDMGPKPDVKVIRIFTDPQGWIANYTNSNIDEKYNHLFKWD